LQLKVACKERHQ